MIEQDFWKDISQTTLKDVTRQIEISLAEGENLRETANRIRDALPAKNLSRAFGIARTETTNALNSGHFVVQEELIADGVIFGREWLVIDDNVLRNTHAVLAGVIVPPGTDYNVGGTLAPHPGYQGLPAE